MLEDKIAEDKLHGGIIEGREGLAVGENLANVKEIMEIGFGMSLHFHGAVQGGNRGKARGKAPGYAAWAAIRFAHGLIAGVKLELLRNRFNESLIILLAHNDWDKKYFFESRQLAI